ncbi:MAG: hypothetical protein IT337_03105, partial [Thermomicrobiales bacterium]|nr:hypothetical protein [Thermomicrobiales bacterium]
LATSVQGTGTASLWRRLGDAAAAGKLDRLRTLNGQFPYDANATMLAYAESMSVVEYIIATHGEDGLAKLIAVFRDGVSYDDAVQQALGVSLDELDAAWRAQSQAQAAQHLAALGVGGTGSGLSDTQALLLASGTLVMGAVTLLAVILWLHQRLRPHEPEAESPPPGETHRAW